MTFPPLAHPSFVISFVFGIHQRCCPHSFRPPPILSSQSRCFSPLLKRSHSLGSRGLRKETLKPGPLALCQRPIYPASLLSLSSREPRIVNHPRSRTGVAGVSSAHFHFDRDRGTDGWVSNLTYLIAEACSAISGFQPTLTGGDGARVPFCEYLDLYASNPCFEGFCLLLAFQFLLGIGHNRILWSFLTRVQTQLNCAFHRYQRERGVDCVPGSGFDHPVYRSSTT